MRKDISMFYTIHTLYLNVTVLNSRVIIILCRLSTNHPFNLVCAFKSTKYTMRTTKARLFTVIFFYLHFVDKIRHETFYPPKFISLNIWTTKCFHHSYFKRLVVCMCVCKAFLYLFLLVQTFIFIEFLFNPHFLLASSSPCGRLLMDLIKLIIHTFKSWERAIACNVMWWTP